MHPYCVSEVIKVESEVIKVESDVDDIEIEGNTILGGSYSIFLQGSYYSAHLYNANIIIPTKLLIEKPSLFIVNITIIKMNIVYITPNTIPVLVQYITLLLYLIFFMFNSKDVYSTN